MALHYNQIARYGEIVSVLVRYGFGDLLSRLNIQRYVGAGWNLVRLRHTAPVARLSPWDRVRMALEELGVTFVKLGQFASNRRDVLPSTLFSLLKPAGRGASGAAGAGVRRHRTGAGETDPRDLLPIDGQPFASASVAQVYRAFLRDGREVAVKVQRPHIEETVSVDIEIMRHLAVLIERHVEEMRIFNLRRLVEEFAGAIRKEMDFSPKRSTSKHSPRISRMTRMFISGRLLRLLDQESDNDRIHPWHKNHRY